MDIAARLTDVRGKIAVACRAASRPETAVTLIAVSKKQSLDAVRKALKAGQRVFGENYVQEAVTKFSDLRADYPDLELHLIGPLQTNKVEEAVSLFDVIETLDRPRLAAALSKAIKKTGRAPRLYVEVNIGEEPQKSGVLPKDLDAFLHLCRADYGLQISGLMCIPPADQDPVPFFERLYDLSQKHAIPIISMGMSADYESAISCGATHVRVGTAIFGERS